MKTLAYPVIRRPFPDTTAAVPVASVRRLNGARRDADMGRLMEAKGAAFDKQFLTMMITHHEGAIEMAEQETAQGSNPDAKALAEKIITDQQAEITTMTDILQKL